MTTTTLRFTDEEINKIDSVTGSGSKTRAGKLRYMINQYALLEDNFEQLQIQIEEKDREVEKLTLAVNSWELKFKELRNTWGTLNTILS